jgi:hypothetical protein
MANRIPVPITTGGYNLRFNPAFLLMNNSRKKIIPKTTQVAEKIGNI